MKRVIFFLIITLCVFLSSGAFGERSKPVYSRGQTVYVQGSHNLASSYAYYSGSALYVRNVNTQDHQVIWLTSVAFYGPDGEFVKEFAVDNIPIEPLASKRFSTSTDALGVSPYPMVGGRPSWVVQWIANPNTTASVLAPIIESARYILVEGSSGTHLVSSDWCGGTVLSDSGTGTK